jgi:hypothetical protein
MYAFTQLHAIWPGSAPLTAAALRPCFQPVVELAWTVLEAGAAAGMFEDGSSSSSSSRGSSTGDCTQRDNTFAIALQLAAGISYELGMAYLRDRTYEQWRPHVQQFASVALLKLMMVVAGIDVREAYASYAYKQQQGHQQQQEQQICVQPYHQQLLAELHVAPSKRVTKIAYDTICPSTGLTACSALAFVLKAGVLWSSNSSSSSSSSCGGCCSDDNSSVRSTEAVMPAPAAAAVVPGISSRLQELLLLTVLEYAVLASAHDVRLLVDPLTISIDLLCISGRIAGDVAMPERQPEDQVIPVESNALLQCLLLELGPAVLHRLRCTAAAGSAAAAATTASSSSSSSSTAEELADITDGITPCLALLCEVALPPGKL